MTVTNETHILVQVCGTESQEQDEGKSNFIRDV